MEIYPYARTGYANPHAVTSVGGTTYTYDNNGNVTAIGSLDYTWDWRNRLASAERTGGAITSYGYDHTGQRVFQATGSATTSYPSRYYNVASSSLTATTTKHIFSPDGTLLATVVGASTTATATYLHPDHLGGTNVTTDADGGVTQTLDYYPFGSQRSPSQFGWASGKVRCTSKIRTLWPGTSPTSRVLHGVLGVGRRNHPAHLTLFLPGASALPNAVSVALTPITKRAFESCVMYCAFMFILTVSRLRRGKPLSPL